MQAYLKSSILTETGAITTEQHEHTQEFNPLCYTGSSRVLQAGSTLKGTCAILRVLGLHCNATDI